jgi:hypothetical protein
MLKKHNLIKEGELFYVRNNHHSFIGFMVNWFGNRKYFRRYFTPALGRGIGGFRGSRFNRTKGRVAF